MRTLSWDRQARVAELRSRIWLYLTPSVTPEQTLLEAAALLQMNETDVLTLGRLHFILSEEVAAFLGRPAVSDPADSQTRRDTRRR